MKKGIIILLTIAVLVLFSSYIFVPSRISVSSAETGFTNPKAAYRYLMDDNNWKECWPDKELFVHNGFRFVLSRKMYNLFEFKMPGDIDSLVTVLQLIPGDKDSTGYLWTCTIQGSTNPVTRWRRYFKAIRIKKTFDYLVKKLSKKLEKEETVYGFRVNRKKVADSVLISTRKTFTHYPNEWEIDSLIGLLRGYIVSHEAREKNYPMLNVNFDGLGNYETMVAISIDTLLPAKGPFSPKLVLKGGNILEAQITGGPATIRKGFEQFENYRSDYRISAPAIPYQLLVTDRLKEADTTKWITRFYYPVF
jgi:hypothetical protein